MELHAVVLAGGSGTRFWPASRRAVPKHFLPVPAGTRSFLAETVARLDPLVPPSRRWILTAASQAARILEDPPELPRDHVLAEPTARDTGPAIALATALLGRDDPERVLAFLPADHLIRDEAAFRSTLEQAARAASTSQAIVTLGIRPTRPATGYGYIHKGAALGKDSSPPIFRAAGFVEKPDHETAEGYLRDGGYLWNCGIFVARAATLRRRLEEAEPSWCATIDPALAAWPEASATARLAAVYPGLRRTSFDYAVMQSCPDVRVVEASFGWDDVGSWASLGRCLEGDAGENRARGPSLLLDTRRCVVQSSGPLIAAVGIQDLVIVATGDAVLVCPRESSERVKEIVAALREKGLEDLT